MTNISNHFAVWLPKTMEASGLLTTSGIWFLVLVVIVGSWRVVNWVLVRPKWVEKCLREQGFKGNSYKFPFGDLKEMMSLIREAKSKPMNIADDIVPRVLPVHHRTVQNYGKSAFIWIGPEPLVNILNPKDIKEVMNNFVDFQKPSKNPLTQYLISGLPSHEGDKWAKHRKIINPAFHAEKLKLMLPAFYQCCEDMINKWKALVAEKGLCELDVWPFFHNLAGDVISRTAFGSNYEEGRRIFQLQVEQAHLTDKILRSIYIPGWRFVPTKTNMRMKEIDNEVQFLLRGIIDKREKAMKAGKAPEDDLLGLLLESNNRQIKEHDDNNNIGMSTNDVIDECKIFYFAGQETTSVLLNWTIVLLSRFPNWQAEAREEVLQVFGTQKPDYDGLNRLKVVTMILYEVLRLYPPAPLLTRAVLKETKLGNLRIPPEARIWIPTIMVHRDEEFWGNDAKEFKPERFSEGILKATNGQVYFLPFGWGPRICIGQNFALVEAKMALSLILQNFSFELSPSYAHAPCSVLTLQPQFGTHIILHKL